MKPPTPKRSYRASPLIAWQVNGRKVRFFHTPIADGRPDLPWVALPDVIGLLRAEPGKERELRRNADKVVRRHLPVMSVFGLGGGLEITPSGAGVILIDNLSPDLSGQWRDALGVALVAVKGDMPADAWSLWLSAATMRHIEYGS